MQKINSAERQIIAKFFIVVHTQGTTTESFVAFNVCGLTLYTVFLRVPDKNFKNKQTVSLSLNIYTSVNQI